MTAPFLAREAMALGTSGFELSTYSARSLAKGNSVVADPEDPSTIAFNPAGITKLSGTQFSDNTGFLLPLTYYKGKNGGVDEDYSVMAALIPGVYLSFSTPITGVKMGLGIIAPFASSVRNSSTGNFTYSSYFNEIKCPLVNAVAAYEINPHLSIGGGILYGKSDLKQVGKLNGALLTGDTDSPFELEAGGTALGWNGGLLWTIDDKNALGIYYRSQIPVHYKGKLSVDDLQGTMAAIFGSANYTTSIDTDITFPDSLTVGYHHSINDRWAVESDFTWTNWSVYDTVSIAFGQSNAILDAFALTPAHYHKTISISAGASYKINERWVAMGGYYFYEMAADKQYYTNAVPDGNLNGFTVGLQYNKKKYSLDLAYNLGFIGPEDVTTTSSAGNGAHLDGTYSTIYHILVLGLTYRF